MTTTDHQLTRCAVCGRHGWHSTDQCPELAAVPSPADTTVSYLQDCAEHLLKARGTAWSAAEELSGARKARAAELIEMIAKALDHAQRLAVVVEGDVRAAR